MDAGIVLSVIFGAVLALFSIFLVGYSFVRGPRLEPDSEVSVLTETDDPALGDIFDAIRTLELERQLGRVPQDEFEAQFQTYRIEAATALRAQLESGRGDPAWLLEQEILLARGAQETANGRIIACPDCSAGVPEAEDNCPHCGAQLVSQP